MKRLQQKEYENYGKGPKRLGPRGIDCLAPYEPTGDGLLTWECGKCGREHPTRMFRVAGVTVLPIGGAAFDGGCGAMNLLVRTNCREIEETLQGKWKQDGVIKENERLRGIAKYNEETIGKIVRFLKGSIGRALDDSLFCLQASIEEGMRGAAREEKV